jgi:hypothetical protein
MALIIIDNDKGTPWLEHPQHFGEASLAAWRPEVGKPGVNDVHAGVLKRNVL